MQGRILFVMAAALLVGGTAARTAGAQQVQGDAKVTTTAEAPRAERKADDETPDHERFLGPFAVGYFGIQNLPIATGFGNGGPPGPVAGPNGTQVAPTTATAPGAGTVAA